MRKIKLFVGVFFVVLGTVLMLHNTLGITGYAVSQSGGQNRIYFSGIFLIIFGVLVLISSKKRNAEKTLKNTKKASR